MTRYRVVAVGHRMLVKRARVTPWHHHPGHPDVVVPRRVDPTGRHGPTPDMVRGSRWRPLGGGWYVAADAPEDLPAQRVVEAAVHLPERSGVTGWAALSWQGVPYLGDPHPSGPPRDVALAIGLRNARPRDGLAPTKETLRPGELIVVDGLRLTIPERSVLFEMRYVADVRAAVRFADMAMFADVVSLDELLAYTAERLSGRTGVEQARQALALAAENAWSPTEVDARMAWELDAGLPRPLCNHPVFDLRGQHVATPDLIDPVTGLAGEYEGLVAHGPSQRATDLDREGRMRAVGIEPVVMVAADRRDTSAFVTRLLGAQARLLAAPPGPRLWTLDPPPWWKPTVTVAQRRALSPADRTRLLAHRRPR